MGFEDFIVKSLKRLHLFVRIDPVVGIAGVYVKESLKNCCISYVTPGFWTSNFMVVPPA
jgi:hypothetical protein